MGASVARETGERVGSSPYDDNLVGNLDFDFGKAGGLRVLITNNTLAGRAGTELYVRDTATELLKRGHTPFAYSPILGEVARELEAGEYCRGG